MSEHSAWHRRRQTAGHEAAHAIVGYLLGGHVDLAEIGGSGDRAGRVLMRIADPFGQVVAWSAGWAFDLVRGQRSPEEAWEAARGDRAKAYAAAALIDPRNPGGVVVRAQHVAGELVELKSGAILRFARRLVDVDRLEGEMLVDELEAALTDLERTAWLVARREKFETWVGAGAAPPTAWRAASRPWWGAALSADQSSEGSQA